MEARTSETPKKATKENPMQDCVNQLNKEALEQIKEIIKNKFNNDVELINFKYDCVQEAKSITADDYRPVFKITYTSYNGIKKTLYVKFNMIDDNLEKADEPTINQNTLAPFVEMGLAGLPIPNFEYIPNFEVLADETSYNLDVLITDDAMLVEDKNNFKTGKEEQNITEKEALYRLFLYFNLGIADNKTRNMKVIKKHNNKNKEVYFDPVFMYKNCFTNYYQQMGEAYVKFRELKRTLGYSKFSSFIEDKENNYCENHLTRLFAEFLREKAKAFLEGTNNSKKKKQEINNIKTLLENDCFLDSFDNMICLATEIKILKEENNSPFPEFKDEQASSEFLEFLIQKRKEYGEKYLDKRVYYIKRNKDKLKKYFDSLKNIQGQKICKITDNLIKYSNEFLKNKGSDYRPLIIGNNIKKACNLNKIKNRHIYNFKNTNEAFNVEIDENGNVSGKQLNRETRRTAEDYYISFDRERFNNAKIDDFRRIFKNSNLDSFNKDVLLVKQVIAEGRENQKNSRLNIQDTIVNAIIFLANIFEINFKETSIIILTAIDNGGFSSCENGEQIPAKYRRFSAYFQETMRILGIYSGRTVDSKIGLRIKRLPKSIVGKLSENKDKFEIEDNKEQNLLTNIHDANLIFDKQSEELHKYLQTI